MSLIRGRLVTTSLSVSDNSYSVNGMIGPTFFNSGQTKVFIQQQEVLPGEYYAVDLSNVVLEGTFNIQFIDVPGEINRVIINHITYLGPFINPQNGLPFNQTSSC